MTRDEEILLARIKKAIQQILTGTSNVSVSLFDGGIFTDGITNGRIASLLERAKKETNAIGEIRMRSEEESICLRSKLSENEREEIKQRRSERFRQELQRKAARTLRHEKNQAQIRSMQSAGFTLAQIADRMAICKSTVAHYADNRKLEIDLEAIQEALKRLAASAST